MAEAVSAPVATAYTREFVLAHLPGGASRVLEVGCGAGELAARLGEDGLEVLAIDSDPDCVAAAQAAGLDAKLAEWPAAVAAEFDAVLFTRSLHHVHDLNGALEAAVRALKPGGRVIVEDFRAEGGSERSTDWFAGLTRTLLAAGAFANGFDLDHTLAKLDVSAHEHELHASSAIAAALRGFGVVEESDAAYYFRYLEPQLRLDGAAEALLEHELSLIAAGAIDALGKRFVLEP